MANNNLRHKLNIEGDWFCTDPEDENGEGCIACNVCFSNAPNFFKEDEDGNAYVYNQPKTEAELKLCQEQLDGCPVLSIGK